MSLERFHRAQAGSPSHADALAEIRAGGKQSHWIWYIFPQLDGLSHSMIAREYALRDLDEACAYLRDPLLRARYGEIAEAVAGQLAGGAAIENLMGGKTDALKLVSSLTLFRAAAARLAESDPASACAPFAQTCAAILQQTAAQDYPPCSFTLAHCQG